MAKDPFRHALAQDTPLLMAWVSSGLPFVVEQMGAAGYDAVLIDQQHGFGTQSDLVNCLIAARAAQLPTIVRPLTANAGLIGAALDAGSQGVLCPLVETVADVEACVRAVNYPPKGVRSWGPYRGNLVVEGDYKEWVKDWTMTAVQLETRGAMDNLDDILQVEGLDMVLVGPNDLALALTGNRDIRSSEVIEACDLILKKAREHSVFAAIFANDIDYAKPLYEAGWDVITVGSDLGMMTNAATGIVETLKG